MQVNYNPDVLTCLANLSNDEVFTPPELVNQMLDLLPVAIWQDKEARFIDPVTKSGVFLREIAKRLNTGLAEQIPDLRERINHIFTQQIFGIAITELTSLLARRSVYCSKQANGSRSICEGFATPQGNILFDRTSHTWQQGKCSYCGASQEVYDREDGLETHAYQFIHTKTPETLFGKSMKFDVIIGNPPYQLSDGGAKASASPIYQKFVSQAIKLNPRYLSMITPSRWFGGGKGLNDFREAMLKDRRIRKIVDFEDANECFPGVDIAGGVNYFLWDRDNLGICEITNIHQGVEAKAERQLDEFGTFIRHSNAVPIIRKVLGKNKKFINSQVSSIKPF